LIKLPKSTEDRADFAKYLQYGLMCRFDTRIGPHKYIIVFFKKTNIKLKRIRWRRLGVNRRANKERRKGRRY
jgi:hypothetical protein